MKTTKKYNKNGVILHEDALRVVIATGLSQSSNNTKTGGMIQIYILHRWMNPLDAIKTGDDVSICGQCKHRGELTITKDGVTKVIGRRCYVQVGKAPNGIFKAYQRGRYRKPRRSEYATLFANRNVRFGAYGDPVFIPLAIVKAIAEACNDWTGYTHQWQDKAYAKFAPYLMASADSVPEQAKAQSKNWRTFRVRAIGAPILENEIVCPASKEANYKTTCNQCKLCNGKKHGATDPRKHIVIIDHSVIAKSQPLISISGLGVAA